MSVTGALFLDGYRELNARKMFWVSIVISAVLVLAFALVGVEPKAITFLHWHFDEPASQFLDGKEFIDEFQHAGVVAFFRFDVGVAGLVFPRVLLIFFLLLGQVGATKKNPRIIANQAHVTEQPDQH